MSLVASAATGKRHHPREFMPKRGAGGGKQSIESMKNALKMATGRNG